jgi:hypothetical protein
MKLAFIFLLIFYFCKTEIACSSWKLSAVEILKNRDKTQAGYDFRHKRITEIGAGAFHGFTQTTLLDFSFNEIELVSVECFNQPELKNLAELNLQTNKIELIEPLAFQSLGNLRRLHLSFNRLRQIEANTFQGLSELTQLHLKQNRIDRVEPRAFASLAKLTLLNLGDNQLTLNESESIFYGCSNLRWLVLSGNRISEISARPFRNVSRDSRLSLFLDHNNPGKVTLNPDLFELNLNGVDLCHLDLIELERGNSSMCSHFKRLQAHFRSISATTAYTSTMSSAFTGVREISSTLSSRAAATTGLDTKKTSTELTSAKTCTS